MPNGLFYLHSSDQSISNNRGIWLILLLPEFNANSVDPDQMQHSAASDLGYTVCQCPFYGMLGLNGFRLIMLGKKIQQITF